MGRDLNAHKIWGRSYAWYRLWVDLAQIRGLFVGVDRGRYVRILFKELATTILQVPNSELETWGYAQVQQGVKALLTLIEASIGGAVGAGVPDRAVQLLNQWAISDPQFTSWATMWDGVPPGRRLAALQHRDTARLARRSAQLICGALGDVPNTEPATPAMAMAELDFNQACQHGAARAPPTPRGPSNPGGGRIPTFNKGMGC